MENVLEVIRYPKDKAALDEAIEIIKNQPDEYIPKLIALFEEALVEGAAFVEKRFDLLLAAYLLAELRVKEAFPVLLALLSLPEVDQAVFFKELLAEEMQRILASVYDEAHEDQLLALLLNLQADIYVVLAAINTLVMRYMMDEFSRTELVTLVDHIIRTHPSPSLVALTSLAAMDAGLFEVFLSVEQAIENGQADLEFFPEEELREVMAWTSKESILELAETRFFQLVDDATADLNRYEELT